MKPPKGFEDPTIRDGLAKALVNQINAYQSDTDSNREQWDTVLAVYDDEPDRALTSFEWPKEVKRPYNVALIQPRVDALVADVVGGMLAASPFWVNRLTPRDSLTEDPATDALKIVRGEDAREALEQTVDFAFRRAGLDRRLREAGLEAVLKGRGVLRLRYVHVGHSNCDDSADSAMSATGVRYSGLILESVKLDDFVIYPSFAESIQDARTVGHAFKQRVRTIRNRQARGEYFSDVEVSGGGDVAALVDDPMDEGKVCYDVIVKLESPVDGLEKWYRATLAFSDQKLLALEEYPHARPWYFSPGFKLEPNAFLPRRSLAAKALEMQTLMNDCLTLNMVGSLAASMRSIIATGVSFDQSSIRLGLGEILALRQTPSHLMETSSGFDPGATIQLIPFIERVTDAVFRIGSPGIGQFYGDVRTATETSIVAESQSRGYTEYRAMFGYELESMAEFGRQLLASRFGPFKAFWGDAVSCSCAADLSGPALFEINGRSMNASPEATIRKIDLALDAADRLGVEFDRERAFAQVLGALDLRGV
jgi:hypothetical protein